jgi:hypothetical protein
MPQFAKLFGDEEQIVVMLGTDDDCPEVRVFCQPPGLGVLPHSSLLPMKPVTRRLAKPLMK